MPLLDTYLDQITTSARSIAELEFPQPKRFTNALLGNHEITTLIRDTEAHEQALFSIDPNVGDKLSSASSRWTNAAGADVVKRRRTIHAPHNKQSSAVARVLGGDMLRQIQQSSRSHTRGRKIDIELLLQGAERLCAVYSVAGANERILALRNRHRQIAASVSHYESKVSKQQIRLNRIHSGTDLEDQTMDEVEPSNAVTNSGLPMTEEELLATEEEIRALEARKRALEDRVAGIEKDLGGLSSLDN